MKKHRLTIFLILITVLITGAACHQSRTRLTYIESSIKNGEYDGTTELIKTGDYLSQDFQSPYDILHGFMIRMDTKDRDNNSFWTIALVDPERDRVLYEEKRNAGHFSGNKDYSFIFKNKVRVEQDHTYQIRITAQKADPSSSLGFYIASGGRDDEMTMTVNGKETDDRLYFSIYGGNQSRWWTFYAILLGMIASVIALRFGMVTAKGGKWSQDRLLVSMLVGAAVFVLLKVFTVSPGFTDEWDNVLGGTMIAQGKVLYRDYVTQHTPVGYYLCAIYALVGAKSIEQFRLLFYLTEAVIWAAVYFRYSERLGSKRIALLAIFDPVLVSTLYYPHAIMIVSDKIQGFCLVVLILEFLLYYKDKELDWKRSAIVSACIWGSIGSAFISAYSIIWVALAVLGLEIDHGIKNKISLIGILKRYYAFVIAIVIPPLAAALYWGMHHALGEAVDQFYRFNREIYPEYMSGMGTKTTEPFILMFQNTFSYIDEGVHQIITGEAAREILPQLIVILAALGVLIGAAIKKRYVEAAVVFLVMCSGSIRGLSSFHGITCWYIAVLAVIILIDWPFAKHAGKGALALASIVTVYLCSFYIALAGQNLRTEQQCVSRIQSRVIADTEYGDPIMIDCYGEEPLYYIYKGRKMVNKTAYMLPWYMDWYEQDTIAELKEYKPKAVIFKENRDVWGYTGYAEGFVKELKKEYHRLSNDPDDGWRYSVWYRNEAD